ncbi:MAG: pitrilysin family protein [Rhodospirillales bacterium]
MNVRTTTLANGLRVISDTTESVETVSVGVWVDVGARHEHLDVNGISHLLEHMAFKGTRRRSARDIAEEIETVGGHLNAYTSRENTAYYAKVLKEDLPLAVVILADILQNATMDPEELERERAVIVQEILQTNDTPDDIIFDHFQETAFPDQALGRSVLGVAERIQNLPRDTIIDFMRNNYNAPRMVLSAAGKLDHDDLVKLAEAAFAGLPGNDPAPWETAKYVGGDFRASRDIEQAHIVLGFEGLPYETPEFYAASIFANLFGGGMSSRLFQEVREKRGLVYSIYSFVSCYHDSGIFGIYAGTGENEAKELMPVICEEIRKCCDGIDDAEVNRARAQLKAATLMSLESTSSRCEQLARQMMIFKRPLPLEEVVEKIEAVTIPDVENVARTLTGGTPTFAALGRIAKIDDFSDLTRQLQR